MAMVLIVGLLSSFDIAPLKAPHAVPRQRIDTITGLATPALGCVEVML
jgi:hypothetical protein